MAETIELNTLGAVVKSTYEGQPDTNAFTDAEKAKLDGMSDTSFSGSWDDLTDKPVYVASGASRTDTLSDLGAIPVSQKAQANGVAPLDASGLVPLIHLNVGGLSFKGAWNPATNTPALIDGTGSVGDFYKAEAAGTFNFGNGDYNFLVGDWVIYAGGTWQRIGTSDAVAMVNGKLGSVVLTAADVGALPSNYIAPVTSVNGKNGALSLNAGDVGALPSTYIPPAPSWSIVTGKPKLSYADRVGARSVNTWYTNTSEMDRIVDITTNYIASSDSSRLEMRAAGTTTPIFSARSQATGTGSTNQVVQATVPAGCQYRLVPGTSRTISTWFEGDYA